MATQNLLEMRAIFVLIFTYSMPYLLVSAFDQSKTFEYLALSKNDIRMNSRVQYKYVLESNFSNFKQESTKIDQVTNRSKRDITELVQNLKFLTSDQSLTHLNATMTEDMCFFENIKSKLDECFAQYDECRFILECISKHNFVNLCSKQEKYTPAIWIINIYEILRDHNFCSFPIECAIIPHENEYLRKLNGVLNSINEYGPAYLNQPKVDNKKYCSKSHHLIAKVRGAFDIFDMCFEITEMNSIKDMIEIAAGKILDRNCHYCISSTLSFESCFSDHSKSFNQFTCSDGFKCAQDRIKTYQCDSEKDITALNIITKFLTNMTNLCSITNQTKTFGFVREWFFGIDLCLKERHHIGLKFTDAPPHFDYCAEIEDTYNCIKSNYKNILEALPDFRHNFEQFAREYNQYMRSCEVQAFKKMTTTANNAFTRHPYKNNSEQTIMEDNKNYYHQTVVRAELDQIINWVNLDSSQFSIYDVKKDHDLSNNYLKATIVRLKFRFPYYGHLLDQIVVATGGFLYVGSLMNPLITKAQYIAPLMANFDPALSNKSMIKYVDNTTHFICTWENLRLQDQPDYGEYTFQVVINHDGQIIFNYKKIPNSDISNSNHTVKIGLSDAYIHYRPLTKSKIEYTIVQYHVVNIPLENVKTGNSIILFMLPNCLQLKTCDTCINSLTNFNCIWCPELQRCSDTVDRYRQEWLEFGCPMNYESQSNLTCFNAVRESSEQKSFKEESTVTIKDSDYAKSVSVGVFLTVFLSMIFTSLIWVGYAYKNPNSTSGIWLIEHRPRKLFGLWTTRFNRNTSSLTRLEEHTP